MAQSVTVVELESRIRSEADLETLDQASSVVTSADILAWVNVAYRELYDLLTRDRGREAFLVSVSVSTPWALPDDFYRAVAIDFAADRPAHQFNFRERNRASLATFLCEPQWRIAAGTIEWRPSAPTAAVTLWYLPTPEAIAADGGFDAFNGWDEFVVQSVIRKCRVKQEESTADADAAISVARERVLNSAPRRNLEPETVADVRVACDRAYYNS